MPGDASDRPYFADDSVCLDLDQHRWIDESADLHHCTGGPDVAKRFTMRLADRFPGADIGHIDSRAHDVGEPCTGLPERTLDVGDRLSGLGVRVAVADNLSGIVGRRGAGDPHLFADAN